MNKTSGLDEHSEESRENPEARRGNGVGLAMKDMFIHLECGTIMINHSECLRWVEKHCEIQTRVTELTGMSASIA